MIQKILDILGKILSFISDFINFRKKEEIKKTNIEIKKEVDNGEIDKLNDRWKDSW